MSYTKKCFTAKSDELYLELYFEAFHAFLNEYIYLLDCL